MGTIAGILGSIIGAGATIIGANKAAQVQTSATDKAIAFQKEMFDKLQTNLKPYMDAGAYANSAIKNYLPQFTAPIKMDQAALEKTPGYQFTQTQGLKAVQNAAAARGLGTSGAALKGAADFSTGLANSTYKDQFNLENINRSNAFNRLLAVAGYGQSSAAGVGNAGMNLGNSVSESLIGGANARAGAYTAGAGAISDAANNAGQYAYFNNLTKNGGLYAPAGSA